MKKIFIGTLVGTLLYFGFQAAMWMGGFNSGFASYTGNQDTIMNTLLPNLTEDGMYMMPMSDPSAGMSRNEEHERMEKNVGKPWAMIFYHREMRGMDPMVLLRGMMHALFGCLIAAMVLYSTSFSSFSGRFLLAMSFAVFALTQGALNDMNWWQFPWNFIRPQVLSLTIGWGLTSVWLANYLKKN